MPGLLRLTAAVDLGKLQKLQLITRHSVLQSVYRLDERDDAYQIPLSQPVTIATKVCRSKAQLQQQLASTFASPSN